MSGCPRRKVLNELRDESAEGLGVVVVKLQVGVTRDKEPGPVGPKAPCLKEVRCL